MWTANPLSHMNVPSVQHNIVIGVHDDLPQDIFDRLQR
jgi:hypothetical protein